MGILEAFDSVGSWGLSFVVLRWKDYQGRVFPSRWVMVGKHRKNHQKSTSIFRSKLISSFAVHRVRYTVTFKSLPAFSSWTVKSDGMFTLRSPRVSPLSFTNSNKLHNTVVEEMLANFHCIFQLFVNISRLSVTVWAPWKFIQVHWRLYKISG